MIILHLRLHSLFLSSATMQQNDDAILTDKIENKN